MFRSQILWKEIMTYQFIATILILRRTFFYPILLLKRIMRAFFHLPDHHSCVTFNGAFNIIFIIWLTHSGILTVNNTVIGSSNNLDHVSITVPNLFALNGFKIKIYSIAYMSIFYNNIFSSFYNYISIKLFNDYDTL